MSNIDNLLKNKRPDLVAEWDYEKNEHDGIDVNTVTYGSHKIAAWKCSNHGHSFEMSINKRYHGRGCPYCANRKVLAGFNDLMSKYPELIASEWDWDKNGAANLMPDEVMGGSRIRAWWKCKQYGHSYDMTINNKTRGYGCPYCSGNKALYGFNDLESQYPEVIYSEWDWEINNDLRIYPNMLTKGSNKIAYWYCSQCGGSYDMSVNSKICNHLKCPYCSGHRVLQGYNDLQTLYPDLIRNEWDYEKNNANNCYPNKLTKGSMKNTWWHCNDCNGSYEMIVYIKINGNGCPYCSGHRVLQGYNDLASQYPSIASEWYQPMNGDITPSMVTKGSNIIRIPDPINPKKRISVKPAWKCSKCNNIWRTLINNRVSKKSGCPSCAKRISKQENQVADFINDYLCVHYVSMKFTMLRSIKFKKIYELIGAETVSALNDDLQLHLLKELDIYIPELNLAFEYDGDYWHSDEMTIRNKNMTNSEAHMIKQELCSQAGINLFFITEHDWLHDTENVKKRIADIIDSQREKLADSKVMRHD